MPPQKVFEALRLFSMDAPQDQMRGPEFFMAAELTLSRRGLQYTLLPSRPRFSI